MKRTFYLLSRPFVWLWKFLSSGLTVLSNLIFLALVALAVTAVLYTPEVRVPMHSALLLAPEGDIVEQRSPMDPITKILNRLADNSLREETFLQDILDTIQTAGDDRRIKLLVLNTNRMGNASLDQIRTIGAALDTFKGTGKKVIAVGDNFNQAQYYLASWADKIYLHPMGAVNIRGFSVFRFYARELLDKLAVNFHVFRVGTFKSAVEPLLRDDMSTEEKENTGLWLGKLWDIYCDDIVKHRRLERQVFLDNVNQTVAQLSSVGGDRARLALATGLVDGLKNHREIEELLIQEVGAAPGKDGFNSIGFQEYLDTVTPSYTDSQEKKELIGIITVSGNILPGKGAAGQIGADDLIKRIRKARQDARVKAIVLRIATGGGSAFASELIREELAAARKDGKIVVVSMGAMAASGGYWLAAEADAIVAAPTTLTGSIGIFGAIPTVDKTLAKIGLHSDGIGTTNIAHFGNLARPMSETEASAMQMDVERGYRQFIDIVAKGRHLSADQVEKLAEGRVWDGATALKLGLVDRLGDLHDAVDEAAKRAKIPAESGYYLELTPDNYLERLKRAEQPVEALMARLWPTALVPDSLRRPIAEQLDVFLPGNNDPEGIYCHSLLPLSALSFQ
ncbi:MAG: signal peptide peptidase SppA [Desulfobulbus sp.]|uniref:signal peptide peptidase SppA n=1 Tax=Desulfobulbus sp. TaxID=895 RepID=UPI00283C1D49|nr:signal peptide peptidase SppA [Desulfobulbus sp.]MDR2549423.1 signal peptide peptidase SppA [Desulfobulbus sp.]